MTAYRQLETQVDKIVCSQLSRQPIFTVVNGYQNCYELDEGEWLNLLKILKKENDDGA